MNYKTFAETVTSLKTYLTDQDKYVDSIPPDIRGLVFDNEYSNINAMIIDCLAKTVFDEHYADVAWFLYEHNERCNKIWIEDREYQINSLDDYLLYARKEMFGDEE